MTDLTPDQIQALREFIAVEVMKLEESRGMYWIGSKWVDKIYFLPDLDHEQCFMALDTFGVDTLIKIYRHSDSSHQVSILKPDSTEPFYNTIGIGFADSFCLAACLAMTRARGYEI